VRAKQAQAWQKVQLLQLRRAVYDTAAANTSHSLALDRLVDRLTGKDVGKVYDVFCCRPVGLDPFRSGDHVGPGDCGCLICNEGTHVWLQIVLLACHSGS